MLDSRFYPDTIKHFKTPAGKGDFRTFGKMWAEVGGKYYLYLDDQVTAKFVKMFMGIRRHLMGKSWFFLPPEHFLLFKLDKRDGSYEARRLPLNVGAVNAAQPVEDAKFAEELDKPMQYKFRDFSYEWFADDKEGMAMGLRYEREEFTGLGNSLYIMCFVPNPLPTTEKEGGEEE